MRPSHYRRSDWRQRPLLRALRMTARPSEPSARLPGRRHAATHHCSRAYPRNGDCRSRPRGRRRSRNSPSAGARGTVGRRMPSVIGRTPLVCDRGYSQPVRAAGPLPCFDLSGGLLAANGRALRFAKIATRGVVDPPTAWPSSRAPCFRFTACTRNRPWPQGPVAPLSLDVRSLGRNRLRPARRHLRGAPSHRSLGRRAAEVDGPPRSRMQVPARRRDVSDRDSRKFREQISARYAIRPCYARNSGLCNPEQRSAA